jgi:DNA-directed RNA polymerase subunit RPC12/RpoP
MIHGYPIPIIEKCAFYDNGYCRQVDQRVERDAIGYADILCSDKCNAGCYFKYYLKLSKENENIKNGFGQACESCSSRIQLQEIRDIHNRLVPLKDTQVIIDRADLQMHGIAFVTVDQMKEYFEQAYDARNRQAKATYKENAKRLVEEVIRDIQTGLNNGRIGGI